MRKRQWGLLALFLAAAAVAVAEEVDPAEVTDETPLTVGLYARIAEQTLPSIVCIRVHAKFSETDLERLKKFKDFQDNPGDHLNDPDFRRFMERYFDPDFRDLHKFFDNPEDLTASSGAGVVFDDQGHIVTNSHVIGSDEIRGDLEVQLTDGRVFRGNDVQVVAVSSLADLAVLKIPATDLKPAHFGDSRKTRIGEPVLAIGHPLELENTVSEGIVSAAHRRIEKAIVEDYFQTTAMINPGNSGGALVNMRGEVIGINIAIATNTQRWQGIGFAVPSHIVCEVVDNLIRSGREGFGWVGLQMAPDAPRDERLRYLRWHGLKEGGVVVDFAFPGEPADKAGLLQDDIIVAVDGQAVKDNAQLVEAVARRPIGQEVALDVRRPGKDAELDSLTIQVQVAERPSTKELDAQTLAYKKRSELREEPSDQEAPGEEENPLGLQFKESPDGLEITRVRRNSIAEGIDLRVGDVILKLNRRPVRSQADFKEALELIGKRAEHLVHFQRGGFVFWKLAPAK